MFDSNTPQSPNFRHLLHEHHIVIEEVDLIVDPKRYVEHWRQRFAKESVDKIFPKIVPDENNPLKGVLCSTGNSEERGNLGKVEYYFEMSERIPEDYALRQRLAMRRLEEVRAIHPSCPNSSSYPIPSSPLPLSERSIYLSEQ